MTLRTRKQLLNRLIIPSKGSIEQVYSAESKSFADIEKAFKKAIDRQKEGIIVKKEDSVYLPGRRTTH
jgi:DNA ligase-4